MHHQRDTATDDRLSSFHAVGIVGAGAMGRGIAQVCVEAGLNVLLHDARDAAVEEAREFITGLWARRVAKGKLAEVDADRFAERLGRAETVRDLADCNIVIEAIAEHLEAKQALFRELEGLIAPEALLATNTSSLSVTSIAASCQTPERVVGLHFFNPVPLMKVVEVIPGLRTAAANVARAEVLVEHIGHFCAHVSDTPGFLVNHAGRAYVTEALAILREGVASPATIDRVLTELGGFRLGPFALMDLTGLDVTHVATEAIYHQYYEDPRLRPSTITQRRLTAGLLGRKSGEGFYRYVDGQAVVPGDPPIEASAPLPVWISREEPDSYAALSALVDGAGWARETSERPGPSALCLVTPLGEDASRCAQRQGLDPRRSVAIDMLAGLEGRRCFMTNPATLAKYRSAAETLLSQDGSPVSRLRDSTGFVLQRVVASIVNVGADIAQQGIATPETLDKAVELGLGYPLGPLAMGDHFEARRILTILDNLQHLSGDPRYRPSPWLRRRAELGLSLRQEES